MITGLKKLNKISAYQISRNKSQKVKDFLHTHRLNSVSNSNENVKEEVELNIKRESVEDILKDLKFIDMKDLSTEDFMLSPLFEYTNEKLRNETQILNYENAKKIEEINKQNDRYEFSIRSGERFNFFMMLKGKEKYQYWSDHISKTSKIDLEGSSIQRKLFEKFRVDHDDDLHDSKLVYRYEGTGDGIRIEDNPLHFTEWYKSNLSNSAFSFVNLIENAYDLKKNEELEQELAKPLTVVDLFNSEGEYIEEVMTEEMKEKYLANPNDQEHNTKIQMHIEEELDNEPEHEEMYFVPPEVAMHEKLETPIPALPYDAPPQESETSLHFGEWCTMVNAIKLKKWIDNFEEINNDAPPLPTYYPTVWGYYNVLPERLRKDPAVMNCVLGLERNSYYFTQEEKFEILNATCYYQSPMLEEDMMLAEIIERDARNYYPTAEDMINQRFCDEEEDAVNSKRKMMLSQIEREIDQPPHLDVYDCLDKTDPTPIEYYDNDDGYWDDYIKEKNRRRATIPLPKKMIDYKL